MARRTVTFSASSGLINALDAAAKERGISRSALLGEILTSWGKVPLPVRPVVTWGPNQATMTGTISNVGAVAAACSHTFISDGRCLSCSKSL